DEYLKLLLKNGRSTTLFPWRKKIREMADFNVQLVREILVEGNGQVFLDSSKATHHLLYLSLIAAFDVHVIWLVRDPRAQVNSALKYNESWTHEFAAKYWKKEMIDNEHVLKSTGLKYQTLRYEDLCRDPDKQIENVLSFIGLDPSAYSLEFRDQQQHIIGNSMRLTKDQKIRERKEWRHALTTEQLAIIEKETTEYQHLYA
ncbi:MAG: sulfotransferase, partial [Bacteroidota bacterium]